MRTVRRRVDALQRACRRRVRELGIEGAADVPAFLRLLEESRKRPLRLLALPAEPGTELLCGAWLPLGGEDFIFYELGSSAFFRDHTVLHECGHMIAGHNPSAKAALPWIKRVFPDLDERLVQGALFRHEYDRPEEVEAEVMAALIAAQVSRASAPARPLATPEATTALDSLARALGAQSRA